MRSLNSLFLLSTFVIINVMNNAPDDRMLKLKLYMDYYIIIIYFLNNT